MKKQPLIKQAWIRVVLFLITFLALSIAFSSVAEQILSAVNITKTAKGDGAANDKTLLIRLLISVSASLLSVIFFRKYADRQSISSLGLQWDKHQSHAATGFFFGILLLGIGSFLLIATYNLLWTDITFNPRQLFISLGVAALIAVSEELVFRGYVLNNLLQSTNKWMALAISALVFALFHAGNPGITALAMLNVFLAGLMLGVNYVYTRNLWFGILLHFSWNFYQGPVLGYKVSGFKLQSLLQQELTGHSLLTGGEFGFEGSVIDGSLALITFLVLAMIYKKKFNVSSKAAVSVS